LNVDISQQAQEQPGLIPGSPPPLSEPTKWQPPSAYTANTGYQYPPTIEDSRWRRHTICGLAAATFWLLLALIVVIVAAAVGGGVGGSLAVNNAKTQCLQSNACAAQAQSASSSAASASSTSSSVSGMSMASSSSSEASTSTATTSTATTAWGPLATQLPYTGCPGNNNTIYTSTLNPSKFQIVCGMDIPFTGTSDLVSAVTPTYELCMELCASWNDQGKNNGNATVPCKGIAFIPTHVNGDGQGNPIDCVLKSYATGLAVNARYNVDSAILL
jgi:hypothetical protein